MCARHWIKTKMCNIAKGITKEAKEEARSRKRARAADSSSGGYNSEPKEDSDND